jgi:signal transduction histidine kinase
VRSCPRFRTRSSDDRPAVLVEAVAERRRVDGIYDPGGAMLTRRFSTPPVSFFALESSLLGQKLRSPQGAVLAATLASGAVTASRALWPQVNFALRAPTVRVAVETTAAIVALIAAFLIAGHFKRSRRLDDLVLAYALSLFAMTNFVFGVIPRIGGDGSLSRFATWSGFGGRLLATIAFAAAAFAPALCCVSARWVGPTIVLVPLGLLALAAAATALLEKGLSTGMEAEPASEGGPHELLVAHPLILGSLLGLVTLFIAAGWGFARRARRERDELIGWLAAASVFAAFARVNASLSQSADPDAFRLADAFRLVFYMTILVGAAREVRSYWSATAELAVLEERRRIARDLHDGLAQELAFICRNLRRLDRESTVVQRLTAAGARALEESRRAIAALTDPLDRPLDAVLADVAQDLAAREGGRVALSLTRGLSATPAQREALVRIASEAITNALRHGGGALVHIQLTAHAGRLCLRVVDAGRGFDPRTVPPGRFGLVSMRERAEAFGGHLSVRSIPGRGTDLEVIL